MRLLLVVALSWLVGCHRDAPADDDRQPSTGCDPVDPALCALPFPSGYFQVDADTPSGVRNAFGGDSLPVDRDGRPLDGAAWDRLDGVSTLTTLLTYLEDAALDGTIGHDDIGAYLEPHAKTAIVDTTTGERVPHFVELDASGGPDAERLLILRPMVPLAHGRRYAVGIRGIVRSDGSLAPASPGFVSLRDGGTSRDADVERQRERFEAHVFPALAQAGLPRAELQRAWEFTTISVDSSLGDVLHIRDDALARIPDGGPRYTVDSVDDHDCAEERIARTVEGRVTVPRYTELATPPTVFARGPDGLPAWVADVERPFTIRIPCSLALDPDRQGLVLQYGHGVLGNRSEVKAGWLGPFLDEAGWIGFAMDWTGMSTADAGAVSLMVALDLSDFAAIPERTQQGFVEQMFGLRMMTSSILDDPALTDFTAMGGRDTTVIDPERLGFYGISMGSILGSGYAAMSPDLERAALSVGGIPFTLTLSRSTSFETFFLVLRNKYLDPREITLVLSLLQTLWDPGEGAGYAHFVGDATLPGTPAKAYLHQVGIGDSQVATMGAQVGARAWGAHTVAPAVRPVWGVEEVEAPFTGSALVEWLYVDGSEEPYDNVPPAVDGNTHECPRREPAAQRQIIDFLETGVVHQHCDGPCGGDRTVTGCAFGG